MVIEALQPYIDIGLGMRVTNRQARPPHNLRPSILKEESWYASSWRLALMTDPAESIPESHSSPAGEQGHGSVRGPLDGVLGQTLLLLSLLMYGASWFLPCLSWRDQVATVPGWTCAFAGVFGFFVGHFEILANPLYFMAIVLMLQGRWMAASAASACAIALGLQTLMIFTWPVPLDEGGSPHYLSAVHGGYFFWLGSMAVVFCFSLLCASRSRSY